MNQLAHTHNAINLAQGFPDFPADPRLIAFVSEAMKEGYNQYAPMNGIFSLREAIAVKLETLYGASYDPDTEITVTVGATQAIYTAITAFVHPGDEVIIITPAYDCYEPAVRINGGIPVHVEMKSKDFKVDWELFQNAIGPKTRMVVINSPHNPSGRVFTAEDMAHLQRCLRNTSILLLSDEAYEHLAFDGRPHQSVSRYPDLVSRSLICASFGKTFHATGWKMGYCAAPAELLKEFRKVHEFNVFAVCHPMQRALARYLKDPENYLNLPGFFQKKRDLFLDLASHSRFRFTPSEGTYFQLLEYSDISEEPDVAFAKRLAREYGLAGIPISVFSKERNDHHQLRFCFAKEEETLKRAGEILQSI